MLRPTLVLLIALTDAQGATPNLAIRRRQPPAAAAALITPAQQELGGAISTGGILGFCAGRATVAAGNAASVAVGTAFIFLSALQKGGYITINYAKLERDIRGIADVNKDGKIDAADYSLLSSRFIKLLSDNGAGTISGVAAGFALGLKTGI